VATLNWPTAARRQILIVVSGGGRVGVDAFIHTS
jgi:hypothetical protein